MTQPTPDDGTRPNYVIINGSWVGEMVPLPEKLPAPPPADEEATP
ncbi:hypothetical protein [Streptomyces sp. NPDC051016]